MYQTEELRKEVRGIFRRKKRSIAERQKRLNRICEIAGYVVSLVVSAVVATVINLMVLR